MQFREAELAILFTLAYTDQFDFPLTESEIEQRLVVVGGSAPTRSEFKKALLRLALQKYIFYEKGFICLAGRAQTVPKRLARKKIALAKQTDIDQLKQVVQKIPSIRGVFITGSLAMENADEDDDLDILIVTKKNRLWLSRAILLLVTWGLGKKKTRSDEGKHGWCLNLWLDESNLAVEPKKNRDLYQAYEVVQALPVYGSKELISKFYKENAWISEFLPNVSKSLLTTHMEQLTLPTPQHPQSLFPNPFMDRLESLAFFLQRQYMKSHQTTEKIGTGFAFFHPRPTGLLVRDGWLKSLKRLKNSDSLVTIAGTYVEQLFAKPTQTPPRSR